MENNNAKFKRQIQQEVHDLAHLRTKSEKLELVEARARNKRIKTNLEIDAILEVMLQRELIKMVKRKDDKEK